jgi:hypothetical protein
MILGVAASQLSDIGTSDTFAMVPHKAPSTTTWCRREDRTKVSLSHNCVRQRKQLSSSFLGFCRRTASQEARTLDLNVALRSNFLGQPHQILPQLLGVAKTFEHFVRQVWEIWNSRSKYCFSETSFWCCWRYYTRFNELGLHSRLDILNDRKGSP